MRVKGYCGQMIGLLVGSLLSPVVMFSSSTLAQTQDTVPAVKSLTNPGTPSTASEDMANSNRVGLQFEDSQVLNEGKLVSRTGTTTTNTVRSLESDLDFV
jgi:hypothetical protein